MSNDPVYLRPEAQPITNWSRMTTHQQDGFRRLVNMLLEAINRPDESRSRSMPWLFQETRTQLAFINGIRGTGKTSLMVTLAAAIDQPDVIFQDVLGKNAVDQRVIDDLKKNLRKLQDRIIIVQPLEMEGLPNETPLLAAILARVYRTAREFSTKKSDPFAASSSLLLEDPQDSREFVQFKHYFHRVAQALVSNLPQRRGQLDPDQFGEAVMREEDDRLMLPADMDSVLRGLIRSMFSERDSLDSRRYQGSSTSLNFKRRIFLVPIDDIDLNPLRCVELLRLLRTFSPPQELFFLLMGQFDLVEAIVKLKLSSEFGKLHHDGDKLLAVDLSDLKKRLEEIAVANVRKMIPPQNRIPLPDLPIREVLEFYPLGIDGADGAATTPIPCIRQLLDEIPLYTERGERSRFETVGSFLRAGETDWRRYEKLSAIREFTWDMYGGFGLFQVPPRRLADGWMQLRELVENWKQFQSLSEAPVPFRDSLIQRTQDVFRQFVLRVVDADPHLNEVQQNSLKDLLEIDLSPVCLPFVEEYPTFVRQLEVRGGAFVVHVPQEGRERKFTYRPILRLRARTWETAFPAFDPPDRRRNKLEPSGTEKVSKPSNDTLETPQTRAAIEVWHDLLQLYRADTQSLGDSSECTSERPVLMSWVGPEGEAASFAWPIPPLPTFAETSRFLRRWHQVTEIFFGGQSASSTQQPANNGQSNDARLNGLLNALLTAGGKPESHQDIEPSKVADLMLLWVWLAMEELENSFEPRLRLPEDIDESNQPLPNFANITSVKREPNAADDRSWSATDHVHDAAWEWIIDRTFRLRLQAIGLNALRTWGQIDKWLRRISQVVQPEIASFEVADRVMERLETGKFGRRLQDLHERVVLILERQRKERLKPLWTDEKFEFWRALSTGKTKDRSLFSRSPDWMLSVVFEPTTEESDLRVAIAGVKKDLEKTVVEVRQIQTDVSQVQMNVSQVQTNVGHLQMGVLEIRNEMRLEFKRQGIRTLLSQAESIAATSHESATRLLEQAQSRTEALLSRNPDDATPLRELANGMAAVAEQLKKAAEHSASAEVLEQLIRVRKQIVELSSSATDKLQAQKDLSLSLDDAVQVAMQREQWKDAERFAEESVKLDRELLVSNPSEAQAKQYLSVSLSRAFDIAMQLERWKDADKLAEENVQIRRDLLAASPDDAQAKRDLSVALNRAFDIAIQVERWKDAQGLADESVRLRRNLLDPHLDDAQAKRDLSVALNRAFDIAMQMERWKDAQGLADESVKISRGLFESNRDNAQTKRDLAMALDKAFNIAIRLERWKDAERLADENLRISRDVSAKNPDNTLAKRDLSVSLQKAVDIAMRFERWKDAERLANETIKIRRDLFASNHENAQTKRDLSVSLASAFYIAIQQNRWKEAHAYMIESEWLAREVLASHQTSFIARKQWASAARRWAEDAMFQRAFDQAYSTLIRCADLWDELVNAMPEWLETRRDRLLNDLLMLECDRRLNILVTKSRHASEVMPEAQTLGVHKFATAHDRANLAWCVALMGHATEESEEKSALLLKAWQMFAAEPRAEIRLRLELHEIFEELRRMFDPYAEPLCPEKQTSQTQAPAKTAKRGSKKK